MVAECDRCSLEKEADELTRVTVEFEGIERDWCAECIREWELFEAIGDVRIDDERAADDLEDALELVHGVRVFYAEALGEMFPFDRKLAYDAEQSLRAFLHAVEENTGTTDMIEDGIRESREGE